ncbi:hypothetical protein ABAZ39_27635 (plasmid) [Azospirillum argentinense]|uniref:Uncharacterized protein n=1 Tax=Azospirillum argentinense TaxID=2970906 RepID=A0A060DP27_9PROT|nr:hypothetical protein ABAZ39_27635 [Azospirillum argentinense]EZQ03759.1 hypothetical protein ABAZ39_29315 [Azospirillum argentinense]
MRHTPRPRGQGPGALDIDELAMLLRTEGGVGGEMQEVGHGVQTPVFEACRIGDVADDDLDPLNGRAGGIGAYETGQVFDKPGAGLRFPLTPHKTDPTPIRIMGEAVSESGAADEARGAGQKNSGHLYRVLEGRPLRRTTQAAAWRSTFHRCVQISWSFHQGRVGSPI